MLPDAELARLRRAQVATMHERCSILRRVSNANGLGGTSDTWTPIATDVPCRLAPETNRHQDAIRAERPTVSTTYRLTVPHDTDLQASDQVQLGTMRYQVVALWDDHTQMTAKRARITTTE